VTLDFEVRGSRADNSLVNEQSAKGFVLGSRACRGLIYGAAGTRRTSSMSNLVSPSISTSLQPGP
jgi:hypothetical protein